MRGRFKKFKNEIIEIHCTYDPESFGGKSSDGRKVKGTLHWVSASYALNVEVQYYDRLFLTENPEQESNFIQSLNPDSLQIFQNAKLELGIDTANDKTYQFERLGYFKKDSKLKHSDKNVYLRVVSLRDSWNKFSKK